MRKVIPYRGTLVAGGLVASTPSVCQDCSARCPPSCDFFRGWDGRSN